MTEPIAAPIGVFKCGPSGAGNGDFIPIDGGQGWIRRDILQRNHIFFALMFNETAPFRKESVIIDLIFDGDQRFIVHDPHLKTKELVTDNPQRVGDWFCPADLPRYTAFSRVGKHKLTVKVAPRPAPAEGTASATQDLGKRDFSPEAGGMVDTYEWEVKPSDTPFPQEQE